MIGRGNVLVALLGSVLLALLVSGCSSSTVSLRASRAADLSHFGLSEEELRANTDWSVQQALERKPTAQFPVVVATVRVQAPGYSSWHSRTRGGGAYSVVTDRDIEEDDDLKAIANLPRIDGVAPLSGLLIPQMLNDDRELRTAAARVHADMLLIYTIDTEFTTDDGMRPLTVFTLGLAPTKSVRVGTTASALLMDTRSGYIFSVAEATEEEEQLANAWTSQDAIKQVSRRTERAAFEELVDRFIEEWPRVLAEYDPEGSGTSVTSR